MSDEHVRVGDSPVTHVVSWSSNNGGHARCGLWFAWTEDDLRPLASVVETDCDCMTCLVKENRVTITFNAYHDIGASVINVGTIHKLDLFDPEQVK